MHLTKNRMLLVLLLLTVLILGIVFFAMNRSTDAPKGMRQVKSYDANGICQAINNPECGYCPNTPIDGKCYVKKGELEQYQ